MASNGIQVEEGNFTRIHNTILERLAQANLNGSEFRCLMFLFRQTYGFCKKEDALSFGQWHEGTGLDKRQMIRTLQGLAEKGFIYALDNGNNRAKTYGFNKYFWEEQAIGESTTSETSVQTTTSLPQTSGESTTSLPQTSGENVTKLVVNSPPTKERKKVSTRTSADAAPAQQPLAKAREPTAHQQYFSKVCEIVGWDYRTLTKEQAGQIAQTVGVLKDAEYTIEELGRFGKDVWVKDWRWTKKAQRPTLTELRQEIGKLRAQDFGPVVPPNGKVEFSLAGML
jgi:phage replication O-like protein O